MASRYLQLFPVPKGFPEILHDFSRELIKDQPEDILEYAALYFEALRDGKTFEFQSKFNVKTEGKQPNYYNPKPAQKGDAEAEDPTKKADNSKVINEESQENSNDKEAEAKKPAAQETQIPEEEELPDLNNPDVQKATSIMQKAYWGKKKTMASDDSKKSLVKSGDPTPRNKLIEYRTIPGSNKSMSALSFGNWFDPQDQEEIDSIKQLVQKAYELGVNYFDTFGSPDGKNLVLLTDALKELKVHRKDYIVSVKITLPNEVDSGVLEEILDQYLKNLNLANVDIVYILRGEEEIPIEATCAAMNSLISTDKVKEWGCCGWLPEKIEEAYAFCQENHLAPPKYAQAEFTMFSRDFDREIIPIAEKLGMAAIPYSDLQGDTREKLNSISELVEIAEGLGHTVEQLAFAWPLCQKVTSCVVIVRSIEEFEHLIGALELSRKLDPEIQETLADLLSRVESIEAQMQEQYEEQGEEYQGEEGEGYQGGEGGDEGYQGEGGEEEYQGENDG